MSLLFIECLLLHTTYSTPQSTPPDLLPIIIVTAVVVFLLLLILLLALVTVCWTSQRRRRRRRRKGQKKENHLYDYTTISVGHSGQAGGEDKDGYAVIRKDSTEKHNHSLIMENEASVKDANGRESIVVESSTEVQGQNEHTYYNTVNRSEVYQNRQAVEEADEEMRDMQHQPIYTNTGERKSSVENAAIEPVPLSGTCSSFDYATIPDKEPAEELYDTADLVTPRMYSVTERGQSAEYTAVVAAPRSTTRTLPLYSQDYATIPDKEPAGLYDTADIAPQNEGTKARPPITDYASVVEPDQDTDDTEQPPPLPAFDPEILYTQPDKTSTAKDEEYATIPNTPGPATVAGYASVGAIHQSPPQPLGVSQLAGTLDPEENYTLTDKVHRTKRGTQRDANGGYAAVDGAAAGQRGQRRTPTQVGPGGYAIPDKRKKRKKQAHSMGTPPDVLEYPPTIPSHKQDSTK